MADLFRFKKGDRVRAGTEEAEVLEVVTREDSYRVKILETDREMTITALLVKPMPEEKTDAGTARGVD